MAEHKLQSTSKLFIPQVIMPQILSTNSERKPTKTITHVLEPIHRSRVLNTGTCTRQSDLFHSVGLRRNHVLATANTEEIGRGFGKMQVNGPER